MARYSFHSPCARAVARSLGCKAYTVFARAVAKSGFCKFIGNFLPLFLQFPSVNFFKIWQLGKTRFQFDDERFKFTNQKLQYFLTMKTTYFNITEKLARSPPFFFAPNEIVAIKFTCTQNIETLHRGNLKKILIMIKKTPKTRDFKLSTILESGTKTFNKLVQWIV